MLLVSAATVLVLIVCDPVLQYFSDCFRYIAEMPKLFYCIMGLALMIAVFHFILVPKGGLAKEHLLYKRMGPILSVPLTCGTHGIFVYCGILLIYLICYDDETLKRYGNLDKTTVAITMVALMSYAFYSMGLIIGDICNPKEEETGKIIE